MDNGNGIFIFWLVLLVPGLLIYFLPTIIAFKRVHHYKNVIFALNLVGGIFVIGWIAALIWAVWPDDKSLADPILGNVTGKGSRNAGDTAGAVRFGYERGYVDEMNSSNAERPTEMPPPRMKASNKKEN